MKKTIINLSIIVTLFIAFVFVGVVIASIPPLSAPMPEYFVINDEEKSCGIYWPGDEFVQYGLPEGWKIYKNTFFLEINTSYGKCYLQETEDEDLNYLDCCKQLNLTQLDYHLVPYYQGDVYKEFSTGAAQGPYKCSPRKTAGIIINEKTEQCTNNVEFDLRMWRGKTEYVAFPTKGECYLTDKNWKEPPLENIKAEVKMITPFGECEGLDIYESEEVENCCKKLGLKFVSSIHDKAQLKEDEDKEDEIDKKLAFPKPLIIAVPFIVLFFIIKYLLKRKG